MRRFWVVAWALGAGLSPASAADFAVALPAKASVQTAATYNWAGLYVGGNIGGALGSGEWTNTASTTPFGDFLPGGMLWQQPSGVVGGAQIGFNFVNGPIVYGLEGMVAGAGIREASASPAGKFDDISTSEINFLTLITAHVGYTFRNALTYIKGGYAGADIRLGISDTTPPSMGSGSAKRWVSGWTIGAGTEIGFAEHWSFGIEYDFASLSATGYELGGGGPGVYTFDHTQDLHLLLARVNYRFGQ
jgi:outer membrane immunogenic protein